MLADIVLGKVQFVDAQVRSTAIQVLADRGEAGVDSIISEALSPSAIVITRRDVAAALIQTGCGRQCIVNVLSFFERIHKGEPLAEEERFEAARREGIPEDIIEIGAGPARVAQEEVTNMLYETMKKQERLVTEVLSKKYGLGTRAPDPFALEMVKELGL